MQRQEETGDRNQRLDTILALAAATNGGAEPTTVKLWPDAGVALGLKRGQTYDAAQRKQIPTLRFGKMLRVPTAWLAKVARGDLP